MGSDDIEKEYKEHMEYLAGFIDHAMNGKRAEGEERQNGFALLIFPINTDGGRVNYISNAQREDMLAAMKEFIARSEGNYHETNGKVN